MKNITKSMVEIVSIPKGRNKYGWYVYEGLVRGRYVTWRFDYRPSLRVVKERMLSDYNTK